MPWGRATAASFSRACALRFSTVPTTPSCLPSTVATWQVPCLIVITLLSVSHPAQFIHLRHLPGPSWHEFASPIFQKTQSKNSFLRRAALHEEEYLAGSSVLLASLYLTVQETPPRAIAQREANGCPLQCCLSLRRKGSDSGRVNRQWKVHTSHFLPVIGEN